MYAKLGDIEFDNLLGFEALSDKRATTYAQQPVIQGKPRLDRTGEELVQFQMTFELHVAFCNPEDEYAKLNDARVAGTVLPFVYGNGFIEGDFVITSIERTFNKTDKIGNLEWITINVTLLEFISGQSAATQQARDKSNAFAISSNRPLPSNPNTKPDNPALDVMFANKDAGQAKNKFQKLTDDVNNASAVASTSPPISNAQAFVDQIPTYIQRNNAQLTKASVALAQIQNLIGLYSSLLVEQPALSGLVTGAQNAITALQNENTILGTLPTTITSVPQATAALGELANLTILTVNFAKTITDLNSANASIAKALTVKKQMT